MSDARDVIEKMLAAYGEESMKGVGTYDDCMRAVLTALADNVSDEMVLVFGQVAAEGLATPEEVAKKFHESSEADKAHLRRAISAAIRAASQPTGEA